MTRTCSSCSQPIAGTAYVIKAIALCIDPLRIARQNGTPTTPF